MNVVLVEPIAVPDTYCSGLAEAEDLGDGNYRFTFFAKQKSLDYAHAVELVVVARIIMPVGAVMNGMQQTMQAMGVRCCGAERLKLRH